MLSILGFNQSCAYKYTIIYNILLYTNDFIYMRQPVQGYTSSALQSYIDD